MAALHGLEVIMQLAVLLVMSKQNSSFIQQSMLFPWLNVLGGVTFGPWSAAIPAFSSLPRCDAIWRSLALRDSSVTRCGSYPVGCGKRLTAGPRSTFL
jgi:hypothetical protein